MVGECPKCWSLFVDYGDPVFDDDWVYYPVTCKGCGLAVRERYSLEFDCYTDNDNNIIQPKKEG